MVEQSPKPTDSRHERLSLVYEPPRVEQVLTMAELEREILYAGAAAPSTDF